MFEGPGDMGRSSCMNVASAVVTRDCVWFGWNNY